MKNKTSLLPYTDTFIRSKYEYVNTSVMKEKKKERNTTGKCAETHGITMLKQTTKIKRSNRHALKAITCKVLLCVFLKVCVRVLMCVCVCVCVCV